MKKKTYALAGTVAVAAIMTFNLNLKSELGKNANITLDNIVALADGEEGSDKHCYSTITKAPDDNSLAIKVVDCSDCKEYWATSASSSSTCS
ncbi:hypothetical protein [Albibacterium indicum]|uniref:hypothetical protein n=1 Tax=Albibacterium indicum TaxID=2292082 RepID=UPI000E4E84B0|nr:hypothetical protein [Pedobacter indicus]